MTLLSNCKAIVAFGPSLAIWYPTGKQNAIGTHSGDVVLYAPQDTSAPKGHIPRPANPSLSDCCGYTLTWLVNPTFYIIYAPPQVVACYSTGVCGRRHKDVRIAKLRVDQSWRP